jgi:hypothetical protein
MSALGQKQTFSNDRRMSGIPLKPDNDEYSPNVRFVPQAAPKQEEF